MAEGSAEKAGRMDGWELRGAWCQMCGPARTHCYTRCYVKDGEWLRVEGCPKAGNNGVFGGVSLCAKGNAAPRSLPSENRLTTPLRRIGAKGPGARFERISWDDALDQIAETMLEQKEEYGPESFGILSPQFYSPLATLGRRLLNVHGSPNYLHSALCMVQRSASANTVVGGPAIFANNSTIPAQLDKTELLVCWGENVESAGVNQGGARRRVEQMERGMKVIDIRPLRDPLAAKADIWLPVRPGTDLALALGLLNVICGEGLYDRDFAREWCNGFPELCEHVRPCTPEWAEERCGIPAEQIREVARMIAAAKPCAIEFGNGIGDQSRDGHWTVCAVQLIGAICGNLGKPGGGADGGPVPPLIRLGQTSTLPERLERSGEDIENGWPAGHSKLVAPEFPRWYEPPGNGGPTSSYLGGLLSVLTEDPYPLRAIFAQSTNPLSATRQPRLVAQALEKLDFYFVMDLYKNPSCDFADIVLPAASQYECPHTIGLKNMPEGSFLALGQKVHEPPEEAMSDWEFYLKLGDRLGYGEDFWHGDVDAWLAEQLAPTGIGLEQLRAAPEGIFVPRGGAVPPAGTPLAQAPAKPDYARMFSGLPHGKLQCRNEVMGGKPDRRGGVLPEFPEYRGPAEGLAETPKLAEDYPLIFSDVHAYYLSQHSYYANVAELRGQDPDPWVKINPATAARYGIEEGDWVRIESPHGCCVLKAQLTEGVSPEVLMGRRGWWQGCEELGQPGYSWADGGAEVNVLYSADPADTDAFHSSYGKQTLVRISRSGPPKTLDDLERDWRAAENGCAHERQA